MDASRESGYELSSDLADPLRGGVERSGSRTIWSRHAVPDQADTEAASLGVIAAEILRFGTLVGTGVSVGSALLVAQHVAPRLAGFDSDDGYRMHDELVHHEGHNVVAAGPSIFGALCAVVLIILEGVGDVAGVFTLVGLVGGVGVGLTTALICAPENELIRRLRTQDERPDYADARIRWWRGHIARVSCGLMGLAAYAIAALAAS